MEPFSLFLLIVWSLWMGFILYNSFIGDWIQERRRKKMTTTIDGFKPPEPEKVVCSDPKKLLAEIAAPPKAPAVQYWTNAVLTIQGYAERVWERSGCSCEPHREKLA